MSGSLSSAVEEEESLIFMGMHKYNNSVIYRGGIEERELALLKW